MTSESMGADPDFAELARPGESRSDPAVLRARLECWLATVLDAESEPEVTSTEIPAGTRATSLPT